MTGLAEQPLPRLPRRSQRARLASRAALLALLASASAGCMKTARQDVSPAVPVDYRQRHPISIKEAERSVKLFIGSRRGALTPAQRGEVLAFADGWRREGTGGIIIDVPAGTPNGRAAADASREVRALLAAAGVPPRTLQMQSYAPGDPLELATMRLSYPKMTARAGPCGLWPDDLGPTLDREHMENRPYWNLGCASQRNLAAMVAEPADLAQPRAENPIYTPRRSSVLDKYRAGQPTAATSSEANKGQISDIAR